ncbi:41556_t:CDS:2 [Gigaspora margarita]|uniref:41556_t:CDS:1 n=1 Tax=Gigaspora margarita TaxID=4874 RepID=A0ABN7UER1_GIGMA|nr:41556_t:CDS:2 [Gigaspora margarita]
MRTLNDTNDANNINDTNNANNTNNNIEEGQGYDSSHAPLNNNDMEKSFDEDPIIIGYLQERQALLQSYPRNKNIKFNPLPMDKHIISYMSKQACDTDKVLSKLAYKFASLVHTLDLVIKHVYETKPPDKDQDSLAS